MELSSTDLVRVIVRSVPSPGSGKTANAIDAELLESEDLSNVPDVLERIEKLFLALSSAFPEVSESPSLKDKALAINNFQTSLGNLIAEIGEPPTSPYTDISDKLSSIQFEVTFGIERINDALRHCDKTENHEINLLTTFKNLRKTLEENSLLNDLLNRIEQSPTLIKESFSPELGDEIEDAAQRSSLSTTKKKGEKRGVTAGLTTKRFLKGAFILTLLSLTVRPETPFNIKDQWDGGKKTFELVRDWESPDSLKIYRDKYSNDPYVLPENVRNRQDSAPAFTGDNNKASFKRISEEGADKSSRNGSPFTNPFVLLFLYYLIRRYVVRPIYESKQGLLRGRNEVRHRQINSPFRGKPKDVEKGSVQTDNSELRTKLWITSVWDPVSTSSVFRLDEDGPSIKIDHRGFRSWLVNSASKFTFARAIRTVPEVKPNLIGGINGSSRGLSLSRVIIPFRSESKRKIVWSKAIGIPDICKLSSRNQEEGDATFPVPPFPGNKVSLPVPAGYTIVGVNAPWNTRLERSTYGTWRVNVPLFFRGQIQYRVAPGGEINVHDEDKDFITAEAIRRAQSEESSYMLIRSCEMGNTPPEVVQQIILNQKKMGATLSYAPIHDHVRSVVPRISADLFDSYPDHTPETLAYSSVHKSRSVGIPAIMATGYRLTAGEPNNLSFVVSERSPSILAPAKVGVENYSEVDIYPTFNPPENCRPQNRVKDFLHAMPAFIVKLTNTDRSYVKIWKESFEHHRASEALEEADLALESPITIKASLVPTHNSRLDDSELKIKVSNTREIADTIKSESNLREGELSSNAIDILVLENVRTLQERIVELARNEPTVRWWSKEQSPIETLSFLISCTTPVEFIDSGLKNAPLLESQAAEVFFSVPEFKDCITRRKQTYLKLMCSLLNAKELSKTEILFEKQREFIESASDWLAKRSSSPFSGKRVVLRDSVTDLSKTVLSPLVTWTLGSIENGFISADEGATLFGNFTLYLRGAYSTFGIGVWDRAVLDSLFANNTIESFSAETYGDFLTRLSEHEAAQKLLDTNGYPNDYSIKLLRHTLRNATSVRGTDYNAKEIAKAALITKSLNTLSFDMGRLWESEYKEPNFTEKVKSSLSVKGAKFFKAIEKSPPCIAESSDSKENSSEGENIIFTPAYSFEESSVLAGSLRLKNELARGMLPLPPGIERNLELRTETIHKPHSKYWMDPISFQSFKIINERKEIGTLVLPKACVWRKLFPETSALYEDVIGETSEENFQNADVWFETAEANVLKTITTKYVLSKKTSDFPNIIRRELSWMLYLLNREISKMKEEGASIESINKAKRGYFEAWNSKSSFMLPEFSRLNHALYKVSDAQALEVRAVVSAWFEHILSDENRASSLLSITSLFSCSFNEDDEYYDIRNDNPVSNFFERSEFDLHEDLTEPIANRIINNRIRSEEFLNSEGFGERRSLRSGMEFTELKDYEPGNPLRDINHLASARAGKPLVNVRQNDEATNYFAWVDLSWLSQGASPISLGSNIEKLVTFLYCCVREHIPISLELFLDGEVVEKLNTRELISCFSSGDKIVELISRLGSKAATFNDFIQTFGPLSEESVMLPETPILGGVHTVLFAGTSNGKDLYDFLCKHTRTIEGSTVISSRMTPPANIRNEFHEDFEGALI